MWTSIMLKMYILIIFLPLLSHCTFGENTTEETPVGENRTTIACYLGDEETIDEYLPFTPHDEKYFHVPSIRMENCSEEVTYPECFPGMFHQIEELHVLIQETQERSKHSFVSLGTSVHGRFVQVLRYFYNNITNMSEPDALQEYYNVCFSFNVTNWKLNLGWHEQNYDRFHYYEPFFSELYKWHYVYFPTIFPIFLIVGFMGNVTVLLILARNQLMWTTANKVVLNLAIADMLFLTFNVGIFYLSFHDPKLMGNTLCYVKIYGENLATAACVYSTALLSFLRYMAIAAITQGCSRRIMRFRRTVPMLLIFIWILAAIAAIPNIVHMDHREFDCDKHTQQKGTTIGIHRLQHMRELESSLAPHLTRLITILVLPLSVILFFSIATTRLLRLSARNIPGEDVGLGNARHERERGAYITLAFVTTFVITHVPIHIANLIFLYRKTLDLSYAECLPLLYIPRILFPLNSCLNPIVLFIASRSFRKYLKEIILCGAIKKMPYYKCRTQTQTSSLKY